MRSNQLRCAWAASAAEEELVERRGAAVRKMVANGEEERWVKARAAGRKIVDMMVMMG
jgi:hypothetical protein